MTKKPTRKSVKPPVSRKSAKPSKARAKSDRAKSHRAAAARPRTRPDPSAAPDGLDALVDAALAVLGIPVQPDWKPAIKANLAVTLQNAALVDQFALPDESEPAPVYGA